MTFGMGTLNRAHGKAPVALSGTTYTTARGVGASGSQASLAIGWARLR